MIIISKIYSNFKSFLLINKKNPTLSSRNVLIILIVQRDGVLQSSQDFGVPYEYRGENRSVRSKQQPTYSKGFFILLWIILSYLDIPWM